MITVAPKVNQANLGMKLDLDNLGGFDHKRQYSITRNLCQSITFDCCS